MVLLQLVVRVQVHHPRLPAVHNVSTYIGEGFFPITPVHKCMVNTLVYIHVIVCGVITMGFFRLSAFLLESWHNNCLYSPICALTALCITIVHCDLSCDLAVGYTPVAIYNK